jgi:hypothetical protein
MVLSEMDDAFLANLLRFAHEAIVAFNSANTLFASLESTASGLDVAEIRVIRVAMQQAAPPLLTMLLQISIALDLRVDEAPAEHGTVN